MFVHQRVCSALALPTDNQRPLSLAAELFGFDRFVLYLAAVDVRLLVRPVIGTQRPRRAFLALPPLRVGKSISIE